LVPLQREQRLAGQRQKERHYQLDITAGIHRLLRAGVSCNYGAGIVMELDRTVILSNVLLTCGGYIDGLL